PTTGTCTLSLHDALPIWQAAPRGGGEVSAAPGTYNDGSLAGKWALVLGASSGFGEANSLALARAGANILGVHLDRRQTMPNVERDRKSTRLNSSHVSISY